MFMSSTFTQKDLILYLYRETDPKQTHEIEEAIEADWELQDELASLKEMVEFLDQANPKPHPTTERLIMEYARKKLQVEMPN